MRIRPRRDTSKEAAQSMAASGLELPSGAGELAGLAGVEQRDLRGIVRIEEMSAGTVRKVLRVAVLYDGRRRGCDVVLKDFGACQQRSITAVASRDENP